MKNKMLIVSAVLVSLLLAGVFYVSQYNFSTGLDRKEEKIIKHGFRLFEEQIGTYIIENYSGISKIEFSPIFIQGGEDNPPFTAHVLPVIYDKEGNRAVLGGQFGKKGYPAYGLSSDLKLDFDYNDHEIIELGNSAKGLGVEIDVSDVESLPNEAKIKTDIKPIDENIAALVDVKKLKNVKKDRAGSPKAKIDYNLEIKRGEYWKYQ